MPREGVQFAISPEWQDEVRARLDKKLGISQNELARRIGCSISTLSEALAKGAQHTAWMPEINEVVGLPQPRALTPDTLWLNDVFESLGDQDKGALLERVRMMLEQKKKR